MVAGEEAAEQPPEEQEPSTPQTPAAATQSRLHSNVTHFGWDFLPLRLEHNSGGRATFDAIYVIYASCAMQSSNEQKVCSFTGLAVTSAASTP